MRGLKALCERGLNVAGEKMARTAVSDWSSCSVRSGDWSTWVCVQTSFLGKDTPAGQA